MNGILESPTASIDIARRPFIIVVQHLLWLGTATGAEALTISLEVTLATFNPTIVFI